MINTGPGPSVSGAMMKPKFGGSRVGVSPAKTGAGLVANQKPAMRFNPPASAKPMGPTEGQAQMPAGGNIAGPSGPMPVLHANGNTGFAGGMFAPGAERRKPLMPSATPEMGGGMTMPNRWAMGGMSPAGLQDLWANYNRMVGLG